MKAFSAKWEGQKLISIRRNLFNAAISYSPLSSLSCVDYKHVMDDKLKDMSYRRLQTALLGSLLHIYETC